MPFCKNTVCIQPLFYLSLVDRQMTDDFSTTNDGNVQLLNRKTGEECKIGFAFHPRQGIASISFSAF
jgi:hypothetical protein